MKTAIIIGSIYLVFTFLQLIWFAIAGAGLSSSKKSSFIEDLLHALCWPIYWLKVLLSVCLCLLLGCSHAQIDSSALLKQCSKVCNEKVRDFKAEDSGAMSCWCDK